MVLQGKRKRGFSILEIMIVVTLLLILMSISVPGLLRAREKSRQTSCQENLIQIDSGIQRWIIDEDIPNDVAITIPLSYLVDEVKYIRHMPVCPSSGTYIFGNTSDGMPVRCSLSARPEFPHLLPQQIDGSGS